MHSFHDRGYFDGSGFSAPAFPKTEIRNLKKETASESISEPSRHKTLTGIWAGLSAGKKEIKRFCSDRGIHGDCVSSLFGGSWVIGVV